MRYGVLPVTVDAEHGVGDVSEVQFGSLDLLSKDRFARRLQVNIGANNTVLIYVHGYHNTFADAIKTAAVFAVDIKFQGVVVVFSWPSAGGVFDYPGDEDEAQASQDTFVEFLTAIRAMRGVKKVHVLAHSMGNRLLIEALHWARGRPRYGKDFMYHLVLAAPDIYTERLTTATSLLALSKHVTLYASDNDQALACSHRFFHGKPRAGQGATTSPPCRGSIRLMRPPPIRDPGTAYAAHRQDIHTSPATPPCLRMSMRSSRPILRPEGAFVCCHAGEAIWIIGRSRSRTSAPPSERLRQSKPTKLKNSAREITAH